MGKQEYLSAGRFAALVGTTKETLFHYDEIGLFVPKRREARPPAGKTVKLKFLGTGMISVMPVPLLAAHSRECSLRGHIRYVPSVCVCRWTYRAHLHRPPSQAL